MVTVELQHPLSPEGLTGHIEAPGKVELISPKALEVTLGTNPKQEERVVVRAGALDPSGFRLASDWTVTIRRRVPPPFTWERTSEAASYGPSKTIGDLHWLNTRTLFARLTQESETILSTVDVSNSTATPLMHRQGGNLTRSNLVLSGKGLLYSDESAWWLQLIDGELRQIAPNPLSPLQVSPDGAHAVDYPKKSGPGYFVDLNSGKGHSLEAPGDFGSSQFDSWSPDGHHYLVQGRRDDKVPGFYIFDTNGQLASTFVEPGYVSLYARWSPNSQYVAFLSIPVDRRYHSAPDGWSEPMFAPRLGVLDVTTGKANYFSAERLEFYGLPLWSPDGSKIAVTVGVPWEDQGITNLRDGQTQILDVKTGRMRAVMSPAAEGYRIQPVAWSPGVDSLVAVSLKTGLGGESYWLYSANGGNPVSLPNKASWVTNELLVMETAGDQDSTLVLINKTGATVRTLGSVLPQSFAVSPDRSRLAFIRRGGTGQAGGEYLTIVQLTP